MTEITIVSKNGTTILLEITGTREDPQITAPLFTMCEQTIRGPATIHESLRSACDSEAGLLFHTPRNIYVQCPDAMPSIHAAIAGLPHTGEVD